MYVFICYNILISYGVLSPIPIFIPTTLCAHGSTNDHQLLYRRFLFLSCIVFLISYVVELFVSKCNYEKDMAQNISVEFYTIKSNKEN